MVVTINHRLNIFGFLAHPELKSLRRWGLLTQDAHALYAKCGFGLAAHPEYIMERLRPYPPPEASSSQAAGNPICST